MIEKITGVFEHEMTKLEKYIALFISIPCIVVMVIVAWPMLLAILRLLAISDDSPESGRIIYAIGYVCAGGTVFFGWLNLLNYLMGGILFQ